MGKESARPKPLISANHAINWYWGNYLMNPNNSLRENNELMQKAHSELEQIRSKLKEVKVTHQEFLDFTKASEFHKKYYQCQKPKTTNCTICNNNT